MEVWLSYSLTDLLLFSPDTYFRLYELNNMALWPLQPFLPVVAFAVLGLSRYGSGMSRRVGLLLLALSWAAVGWWFLYQHYAQINTAAPWYAAAFAIEALLIAGPGFGGTLAAVRPAYPVLPGLMLFLYALVVHPLIGPLFGRPWSGIELFGAAPDPTAMATLGILLMMGGKMARLLSLIPLAWCLVSGLTFLAMEITYGLSTPAVAVIAVIANALLSRRARTTRA
ncbi:MAG: DUF6064 family protein [Sedimenticola sp.]